LLHALVLDISLPLQFVPHDKPLSASSFHSFQGDFPMSSRDQQAAGLQRDFLHKPPVWQLVFTTKTTEIFCRLQDAHCNTTFIVFHCSQQKHLQDHLSHFNGILKRPLAIKEIWKIVLQN
jgi:hypothetical protein